MSETWRPCPFEVGRRYRVKRDFSALRDAFVEGEVVTYRSDSYSRYDGITGFLFAGAGGTDFRVWDVDDGDPIESWQELFEPMEPG